MPGPLLSQHTRQMNTLCTVTLNSNICAKRAIGNIVDRPFFGGFVLKSLPKEVGLRFVGQTGTQRYNKYPLCHSFRPVCACVWIFSSRGSQNTPTLICFLLCLAIILHFAPQSDTQLRERLARAYIHTFDRLTHERSHKRRCPLASATKLYLLHNPVSA